MYFSAIHCNKTVQLWLWRSCTRAFRDWSTSRSCSTFSADFTSGIEVKVSEMFLDDMVCRYTRKLISIHQDRGNQESCSLENWCNLIFSHFLLSTDWVCASGLRYYFACDPFDFRFRPQEKGYSQASPQRLDQGNPTSIICSSPWKRIHGW